MASEQVPIETLSKAISSKFTSSFVPSRTNPNLYLSQKCFDESDKFREELTYIDTNKLIMSKLGDEFKPKMNNNHIGIKRNGIQMDNSSNKKRKLNQDDTDHDNLFCIDLDAESAITSETQAYIHNFELINENDIDIRDDIKYINKMKIEQYLNDTAICNGYTVVQREVSDIICLGLTDHLKRMFDEMNKWRMNRMDNGKEKKIKYDVMDCGQWIAQMNEKYASKQAIVETKDEIEALETEKADLDFKKMTGILTEEEEKRKHKLDKLIKNAQSKQNSSTDSKQNQFMMTALGGDFSFNFGGRNNNAKKKKKVRQLQEDKFYVIDIINMMENHQKYCQQNLQQLANLYRKQA